MPETAIQAERREIFAQMDALKQRLRCRTEPIPKCGRPTKTGSPCKRVRVTESWAEPEPSRIAALDRSPGYLLATYLADGD